jgi:hypothetical protein
MKWGFLVLVLFTIVCATMVLAAPVGPDRLNVVSSSSRLTSASGKSIPALAGNVSELSINNTVITTGWQGYYGNVTGTIVLDDALNNTMYSWSLADPRGEIFATRDTDGVNWGTGNIVCADLTEIGAEETALNFNSGGVQSNDGFGETFAFTTHPAFSASGNSFAANACNFTVSTYVNDGPGVRSFNETLLYSTSDTSLVYAALIFPGGSDGFKTDATAYDFQMLVAEDGHGADVSPTNYYFYVELE